MMESEQFHSSAAWKKAGNWKARYSQLYSSRRPSVPKEEQSPRVSFMNDNLTPYGTIPVRFRGAQEQDGFLASSGRTSYSKSLLSYQSDLDSHSHNQSHDFGEHDTMLLNMVRARMQEAEEALDQPLDLPRDDSCDDQEYTSCVHGLSVRNLDGGASVSRSRISRMSTRRDMDIPSILAFNAKVQPPEYRHVHCWGRRGRTCGLCSYCYEYHIRSTCNIPKNKFLSVCTHFLAYNTHLEIPAFTRVKSHTNTEIPRWSIRRSVCPVCSQKWKDKTSIQMVKYSGLKRNSSMDLPTVIAPARLRTSITIGYVPRPAQAALDDEAGVVHGGWRSSKSTWQLTRARRFRAPKPHYMSPEATAPPGINAPTRKDLDTRVSRFLAT